jgi:hypothetical protein
MICEGLLPNISRIRQRGASWLLDLGLAKYYGARLGACEFRRPFLVDLLLAKSVLFDVPLLRPGKAPQRVVSKRCFGAGAMCGRLRSRREPWR